MFTRTNRRSVQLQVRLYRCSVCRHPGLCVLCMREGARNMMLSGGNHVSWCQRVDLGVGNGLCRLFDGYMGACLELIRRELSRCSPSTIWAQLTYVAEGKIKSTVAAKGWNYPKVKLMHPTNTQGDDSILIDAQLSLATVLVQYRRGTDTSLWLSIYVSAPWKITCEQEGEQGRIQCRR